MVRPLLEVVGIRLFWARIRSAWSMLFRGSRVAASPDSRRIVLANQIARPLTVKVAATSQCEVRLSSDQLPVQGTVGVELRALPQETAASFELTVGAEGTGPVLIGVSGRYDGQWKVATTVYDRTLAVGDPAPPVVFHVEENPQDTHGVVGSSGWLELELQAKPGGEDDTYPSAGIEGVTMTQLTFGVPVPSLGSVGGKTLVDQAGLVPKDHWKDLVDCKAWITVDGRFPPYGFSGCWKSSWGQDIAIAVDRGDAVRILSNANPLRLGLLLAPWFSGDPVAISVGSNYWVGGHNHSSHNATLYLTRSTQTLTDEPLVLPIFPAAVTRSWQQIGEGTLGGVKAGVYRGVAALQPLLLLADVDGQGIPQALAEAELAWRPLSYLWLDNEDHLTDPALAAAVLAAALNPTPVPGGFTVPRLVWAAATNHGLTGIRRIDVQFDPLAKDGYQVTGVDFPIAGRLSLCKQYDCKLVEDPLAFRFISTQDRFSGLGVRVVAAAQAAGGSGEALELGLSAGLSLAAQGAGSGQLSGGLWIVQGPLLFELGAEIRSARWTGSAWEVAAYPLQSFLSEEEDTFAFRVLLDPLRPFDPGRTRLDFDPQWQDGVQNPDGDGKINDCKLDTFRRTAGDPVPLRPAYDPDTPSGFALAASPLLVRSDSGVAVHDLADVYLTPNGTFRIEGQDAIELMGGTCGTEYFFVPAGGELVFHPGNEAEAGVLAGGTHHGTDRWTTAWTEVKLAVGTVRWCTQARSTTQYVTQPSLPGDILAAASPQLAAGTSLGPFPALPQGGLYEVIQRSGFAPPIRTDSELPLAALEQHAAGWAANRRGLPNLGAPVLLEPDHSGPRSGHRSRTPQGLVADLNQNTSNTIADAPKAGTWKSLHLATYSHAKVATQSLDIQADPVTQQVNADLAIALANGDGIIAVGHLNTYFYPGGADGKFKLGDFTYETATSTVALLKLDPRHSLADLVQPERWNPKVLGCDADSARRALCNLYAQATASDAARKRFAFFLDHVWNAVSWTGLLFVDLAIDQQDLPPSIQMLLGGMENLAGGLRAQVFGLTLNKVINAELDGDAPMKASSMFSVLFYEDAQYTPPQDELKLAVTLFAAVTVNSKLAALEATVEMTVPALWDIPVLLDPPGPNGTPTLTLSGHRVDHPDGTASLVFAAASASSFQPPASLQGVKVLDSFAVQDAALAPIGSDPENQEHLISAFDLAGALSFDAAPLASAGVAPLGDLDLFGFGEANALPVPRYRVRMTTDVPAEGRAKILGYEVESASIPVPPTAARQGSVVASLHLAVASIEHAEDGFGGAHTWPLTLTTESGSPAYGVTPHYALKLLIPIGPAGALSSSHSQKSGWIYLGWSVDTTNGTTLAAGAVLDMNGVTLMLDDVIHSHWQQVDLVRVGTTPYTPTLCFRHFQSSIFGLDLINALQGGLFPDLFLFGAADRKDLLWYRGPAPVNAHVAVQFPYYAVMRGALPPIGVTVPNPITAAIKWSRNNFGGAVSVADFIAKHAHASKPSDVGLFVGIEEDLLLARFAVVLDDAGLWGGLINIPQPSPWTEVVAATLGLGSALKKLVGLLIEIAYRKVHDGLGLITVFFVPPGSPYSVKQAKVWAPSIGWSQWTNGDWQLAVGWPMDANPVKIQAQVGSFPLEGRVGLILGEMQGGDGLLGAWSYAPDYAVSELGIGLAVGFGKSGDKDGLKWYVAAVVQVTGQGFFASWTKDAGPHPVPAPEYNGHSLATYNWGTVTAGVLIHGEFSLGFKLIDISGSLDASLVATFVLETCHSTSIKLTMGFAVEIKIRLAFFTLHFDFRATLTLGSWTVGDGPAALASGATPEKLVSQVSQMTQVTETARLAVLAETVSPPAETLKLTFFFAVQPFAEVPGQGDPAPCGLALLGVAEADFPPLVERFARWLLEQRWDPGHGTVADLLAAIGSGLTTHPLDVDTLMQEWVAANLERGYAVPADAEQSLSLLPMFPDLGIAAGGRGWVLSVFGDPLPANYPEIVAAYYGKQPLPTPAGTGRHMAEHVFEDGWNLLAHLLLGELAEIAGDASAASTADATWSTLQNRLQGKPWSEALARLHGQISRHALSGSRLPDPASPASLVPLHHLSGQLVRLKSTETHRVELFTVDYAKRSWIPFVKIETVAAVQLTPAQLRFHLSPAAWTLQASPAIRQSDRIWQLGTPRSWAAPNLGEPRVFLLDRGLSRAAWSRQAKPACFTAPTPPDGGHLDLHTAPRTPYTATSLLALPLRLRQARGADKTYELASLGEAPRALLEKLLTQGATVGGLALVETTAGTLTTLGGTPAGAAALTLVRANLSTSSRGPDAGAPEHLLGPNFAIVHPGAAPADLTSFLTLVWETSVSQTGGFYLQGDSLDGAEEKSLLLVVQVTSGAFLANALAGGPIPAGQQLYATLDLGGQRMLQHSGPAVPAGAVGWKAARGNTLDGTSLQDLYHTPVWRWRGAAETEAAGRWSRPVHVNVDGTGAIYASSFAPPSGGNRYAAVWNPVDVEIGLVDPVGHLVTGSALARVASGLAFASGQRPVVLYNDAVVSLGQWPGCKPDYRVQTGPALVIDPGFDAETLLPGAGDPAFATAAQPTVDLWGVIWDQLDDPHLSVSIDSTLGDLTGASPKTSLQGYLTACIRLAGKQIGTAGIAKLQVSGPVGDKLREGAAAGTIDPPQPLSYPLEEAHPETWGALLAELTVAVRFERAPADGSAEALQKNIYDTDPAVCRASSFVPARQDMVHEQDADTTPGNLRKLASDLETAYTGYAGAGSKLKLSVGTVSEPSSERFGQTALWLMRWGQPEGVTVEAHGTTATYLAPPPLSTRLWTGTANAGQTDVPFLAVDTDAWAAGFLETLESLFGPSVAPRLANPGVRDQQGEVTGIYDALARIKAGLAGSISKNVLQIYTDGAQGDLPLAGAVMQQALLRDLRQDYGTSTVLQVQTQVTMTEPVEAGARLPPQVFGPVHGEGANTTYSLTPAKLPLDPSQPTPWLTSLVHAVHPDEQRLLTVSPTFYAQFLEHLRDVVVLPGDPGGHGYVPSAWLSFLLPEDPVLEASLGALKIPIPLRRFPSRPKLLGQTAAPANSDISDIGAALGWSYSVTLEKPLAAQDTLYLRIVFNEKPSDKGFGGGTGHAASAAQTPLFQALAVFHTTWPELRPHLPGGGQPGSERAALQQLQALLDAVNDGWQQWKVGETGTEPPAPDHTYWEYALTWDSVDGPPTVKQVTPASPPLPPTVSGTATATLEWKDLYVVDLQSARAYAWVTRNEEFEPDHKVNGAFVYATDPVRLPEPIVPLIEVPAPLLIPGDTLKAALTTLLSELADPGSYKQGRAEDRQISYSTAISYSYGLVTDPRDATAEIRPEHPLYLVATESPKQNADASVTEVVDTLVRWQKDAQPAGNDPKLRLEWTLFSTKLTDQDHHIPLVRFHDLGMKIGNDWWR